MPLTKRSSKIQFKTKSSNFQERTHQFSACIYCCFMCPAEAHAHIAHKASILALCKLLRPTTIYTRTDILVSWVNNNEFITQSVFYPKKLRCSTRVFQSLNVNTHNNSRSSNSKKKKRWRKYQKASVQWLSPKIKQSKTKKKLPVKPTFWIYSGAWAAMRSMLSLIRQFDVWAQMKLTHNSTSALIK